MAICTLDLDSAKSEMDSDVYSRSHVGHRELPASASFSSATLPCPIHHSRHLGQLVRPELDRRGRREI